MKLHELSPVEGSTRERKRVGRGAGSGQGKTSGKGHKGQKARSGYSRKPGFEGGQNPLKNRLPKRGFNNIFATRYAIVNLSELNVFENGTVVDMAALKAKGIVKKPYDGLKVLGNGELSSKVTIKANAFSASAKGKIEASGGKLEVI